jgi:phosphoribosylamine-glycine ligase
MIPQETKSMKRFILKQNGDAPKSLNHIAKFSSNEDLIHHIEQLKNNWNVSSMGPVDFDIMEVVEGLELAASAWFNGEDWMRDANGKVVGYLNFEEKKEVDGGLGETTGEMGTTFIGVNEDNPLFKDIILRPKITSVLKQIGYRGVFDINCIKTKEGIVALEPTCRFGVPATSYEFIEGLVTPASELLVSVATGKNTPVEVVLGVGMVMVVAGKPFPVEADMENEATSIGERLWILKNKKPVNEFSDEQRKHIQLQNFEYKDYYRVATKNGYLLTVTGVGKSISSCREQLIDYIKENLYLSGMKYRSDIGKRVEDSAGISVDKVIEQKVAQKQKEVDGIKTSLRKALYG